MEDLLERIENLESWKSETEKEIVALREVVAKQEALIEEQARILESYTDNTSTNEPDIEDSDNGINKKNGVSVMDSNISSIRSQNPTKLRRGIRQSPEGVAFTAFLSYSMESTTSSPQPIKFDKAVTNEGNGYNPYTGVFTCPKAGLYLFSLFLGEHGNDRFEMRAALVVNSRVIVSGTVETHYNDQDLQGGNMAVIRLNVGDAVWVETYGDGLPYRLLGETIHHVTTFTGVYLHA